MPPTIEIRRSSHALIIQFNRPERRNALSAQLMKDLDRALHDADTDASISTVIITGGDQFFSAGADLNEALKANTPSEVIAFVEVFHTLARTIERLSKPVIAAVEGFCMTGGCELALACDLRVGARGSSYAITSSRIGTVAGFGGTQRLPRIVGPANALEILFAAEPIDAEHAFRIGLINRLTEKGQSLTEAEKLAATYAQRAPMSLAFAKRAVLDGMQMGLTAAIEFEKYLVTTIYSTEDKREGISAFLEKRQAQFTGR